MYIPPSQYKTGFYSYQQYSLNGELYTGPYWELLNGEKYTGESPSNDSQQLTLFIPKPTPGDLEIAVTDVGDVEPNEIIIEASYTNLSKINASPRKLPTPYTPTPTSQDYKKGFMLRYFVKKNNSFLYMETTRSDYLLFYSNSPQIASDLYDYTKMIWFLSEQPDSLVAEKNKKIVLDVEKPTSKFNPLGKNWLGFSQIFNNDYIQFFPKVQENLYTSGGEFQTPDGMDYVGPYHNHPTKGPMVGAKHVSTPHSSLIQVTGSIPTPTEPTEPTPPTTTPIPTYTPPPTTGGGISSGGGGGGY
jgi:hypothetical protein